MAEILLHIGYRKAASTFIRAWFHFHPELKIQPLAAFDPAQPVDEGLRHLVFSEAFLLFKGYDKPRNIANLKAFQREQCAMLYSRFPGAHILLITREPEKTIHSEYSEYIKNGGFHTFDEMKHDPLAQEYFTGHYDFNFVIGLYRDTFGADRMTVLPMELLEDNPEQFVTHLEQRLGLTHFDFPYHKRNPSLTDAQLQAFRKISSLIWKCTWIFGKKGRKMVYYLYIRYLEKNSYSNRKLRLPIYLMTRRKSPAREERQIPPELLEKMKSNATILRTYPIYERYLDKYCDLADS